MVVEAPSWLVVQTVSITTTTSKGVLAPYFTPIWTPSYPVVEIEQGNDHP